MRGCANGDVVKIRSLGTGAYEAGVCRCSTCRDTPTERWLNKTFATASDNCDAFGKHDEYLLRCPPKVLGYVLDQKIWGQFLIKDLKDSQTATETRDKEYFNTDLQLDTKYKDYLLAYIGHHEESFRKPQYGTDQSKDSRDLDVIKGKGRGLAILLHGTPGVGKTLTAETIAMATGRPLLPISVAEIGISAENAESKLSPLFEDAQRWAAILLIDEADVFLEARGLIDNHQRNALVSVLLRCLEYYEGIIILTTNRINSIDIVVQSRMHLAIQYRALKEHQKLMIFKNLLAKIDEREFENKAELLSKLRGSASAPRSTDVRSGTLWLPHKRSRTIVIRSLCSTT
ncbi:hypothetical protein LTR37_004130 [Vermiconidia calcicola]|uniref:Uncharacterized protein n=1 Tax=Vermiconidia calcicola TaxID=1690605 RepID=A0ACC3NNL2_9PEZI|nr:hypothetical protein LTR37_004130 [Vermiconidia calcicola]